MYRCDECSAPIDPLTGMFSDTQEGRDLLYYKRLSKAAGKMEKCAICPTERMCPDCDIWNTWQSIIKEREK